MDEADVEEVNFTFIVKEEDYPFTVERMLSAEESANIRKKNLEDIENIVENTLNERGYTDPNQEFYFHLIYNNFSDSTYEKGFSRKRMELMKNFQSIIPNNYPAEYYLELAFVTGANKKCLGFYSHMQKRSQALSRDRRSVHSKRMPVLTRVMKTYAKWGFVEYKDGEPVERE